MRATCELRDDRLIATRFIDAPPAAVWRAFTTAEGVAAFWGGSHAVVPPESVVIEPRPGGTFELDTRAPDGRTHRLAFTYVSLAEPDELVFDEPITGLRTAVTIRAEGEGAHVAIRQRRLPAELRTAQARDGLASILDALADHLETNALEADRLEAHHSDARDPDTAHRRATRLTSGSTP